MITKLVYMVATILLLGAYWIGILEIADRPLEPVFRIIIIVGIHAIAIILIVGIQKHWYILIDREWNEASRKKVSETERKTWNESKEKAYTLETELNALKEELRSLHPNNTETKKELRKFFMEAMKASMSTSITTDSQNKTETKTISAADSSNVKVLVDEFSKIQ